MIDFQEFWGKRWIYSRLEVIIGRSWSPTGQATYVPHFSELQDLQSPTRYYHTRHFAEITEREGD